jgi:hypothetical protein
MDTTNVNLAKCIVEKNHIGYDDMVNFCTGQTVRVDWVAMDWVAAGMLFGFILLVFAIIGYCVAALREI